MAKFKRFDPRNKKATRSKEFFPSKSAHSRNKLVNQMMETQRKKYDEKTIYTPEDEFEL